MSLIIILYVLLGVLALLIIGGIAFSFNPFKRPHPTESDLTHAQWPMFYLYYTSRYLSPVKRAEKGSGLEEMFSKTCKKEDPPVSEKETVSLRFTGDLMYRKDNIPPESPDLWTHVAPWLFSGDIKGGNLEFAVNKETTFEKLIRFSIPPLKAEHMIDVKGHGKFDVLFTANNHINDSYSDGIFATNYYLDAKRITHVGANARLKDIDQTPIIEKRGIKVAFLAYSFSTNGIPLERDKDYGVNLVRFNAINDSDYDPSMIYRHIDLARERGADIVVVSCHWGVEFHYYPFKRLVDRAHGIMDAGADVIIGHHPHILNPSEWYRTKDGRNAVCCYSLGNITGAGLLRSFNYLSEMVSIEVEKGKDQDGIETARVADVEIMPTFYIRSRKRGRGDNHIVPLLRTCEAIRSGESLPWLRRSHKNKLLKMEKEYKKYFYQNGFRYV